VTLLKVGYACTPLTTKARTNRRLTLKNYSEEKLKSILADNLKDLNKILKHNLNNNIKMFRISSDIIPLGSHIVNTFNWKEYFKEELIEIGEFIKKNHLRVSMHPGQYTVINSPNKEVVFKSIKDLQYHCDFLDSLDVDYTNKLILHIGGIYNDKKAAKLRFIENFNSLPSSVKNRLVIENDEKNFSLNDVLEISHLINVPVVFDNLHNSCYGDNNYTTKEIYEKVLKTWKPKDGTMKVHYSQQAPKKKLGSHSQTIFSDEFLQYYNEIKEFKVDIMLEVKDKDISAIKCINLISEMENSITNKNKIREELLKYKYLIMEHDYSYYEKHSFLFKNKYSFVDLYKFIDEVLRKESSPDSQKETLKLIWSDIETKVSLKEKNHFIKIMKEKHYADIKAYLEKLCNKYNISSIIESYYFSQI
jgi:UV DNA damage endonuclease